MASGIHFPHPRPALRQVLLAGLSAASLATGHSGKKETVPRTELSHPCSRTISRNVRKQVQKEVLKPSEKAGITSWPFGCPLDPARDLFGDHEKQKSRKRGTTTQWVCGYCQKVFKNEHYLDMHMERKHMSQTPANGVCLADYCEIFDSCYGDLRRPPRRSSENSQAPPPCSNETMAKERKRCGDSLTKCLPLEQDAARQLHAKLSKHFCQTLDCRIRAEQHRDQHAEMMPVIVILILVVLCGFVIFSLVVCCVDYSDDILNFLVESKVLSPDTRKQVTKARETTRKQIGIDRTKGI
eukprot:TRINITY_DN15841_c0_g1_i1.p1 TRINITY_DN15841_c0_g1~~TRINITY_DN15841_c0_g1_i1.p1  ORF type:complete len:297 (+),score=52.45 TRINITY_DN15841_c0_g1_i1:261-1151(+)